MIDIYFEYQGAKIKLPINPQELKKNLPGNNENTEVVGLGEISVIRLHKLVPITIESFFPEDENPKDYVAFFETIIDEAKPCRLICGDFDLNMQVSIVGFEYAMRGGEEGG